ncbi:MAG: hypothetical protein LBI36_01215 [Oscillospiraceae bacterium]|jgi:hypothetical protein|nr:hypothetical protein [Oscillospiraceae bacterium]
MLEFYTAFTKEIDDPEEAAKEILEQLNPKENMLENTVGLIFFHYDFAEDDILLKFAELMPFELAGCVSNYTGVSGGMYGNFAVSVTMITGDDVSFAVETFDGIDAKTKEQIDDELTRHYEKLRREEKPKFIMTFLTAHGHYTLNNIRLALDLTQDPTLCYGMHAFNIDGTPDTNYTFGNGRLSVTGCVLIAFYGNVTPEFHNNNDYYEVFLKSYTEEAVITDCDEAVIKTIDGTPALDYLRSKGVISDAHLNCTAGIASIPVVLTYPHGGKAPCMFLGVVEGTKYIQTARDLEKGAKVSFFLMDAEAAIANICSILKAATKKGGNNFIIFCSAAQAWAISANNLAELQEIDRHAREYGENTKTPLKYAVAYSGGELCPISSDSHKQVEAFENGGMTNMVHNFSLALCAFNYSDSGSPPLAAIKTDEYKHSRGM